MADERETKVRELDVKRFRGVWWLRFDVTCLTLLLLSFIWHTLRSDDHWALQGLLALGMTGWWWTVVSAMRIAHHVAGAGIRIAIQKKPTTYSVKVAQVICLCLGSGVIRVLRTYADG